MKKPTLKSLRKKAWDLFSKHVRSQCADLAGYAECYTCRKMYLWKEMDAGHYIHGKLDFDTQNVHPQCVGCNKYRHGNLGLYAERLVEDYGKVIIDSMRVEAATWTQPNREECLKLIEKLKLGLL